MIDSGISIEHGSTLKSDICIIGGGAAGITIAREFIDAKQSVILLESGGFKSDRKTQALYSGENTGVFYNLTRSRLRYFGGSTNHWSGMCRPMEANEFKHRTWIPDSGWPISKTDLQIYYLKAQKICELGPFEYSENYWREAGLKFLDFSEHSFNNQVYRFGPPTRFGEKYRKVLKQAGNIQVLLDSNLTELVPVENSNTVQRALVSCRNGNKFTVKSKVYILASGGIENARNLLVSNSVIKNGLGNQHDNVGRYFMDHIRSFGVATIQTRKNSLDQSYYRPVFHHKRKVTSVFNLSPEQQEKQRVGGFFTGFYPVRKSNAALSYRALQKALASGKTLKDQSRHMANIRDNVGAAMEESKRMVIERQGFTDLYTTIDLIEQVPDRESRVGIGQEKDSLGIPKTIMHWKYGNMERKTLQAAHQLLEKEFKALNIGVIKTSIDSDETKLPGSVEGAAHHMGTTRMHDTPKKGVVDRNCQVFDSQNLYIAGSSVFTTGGTTNPTLTIVSLALRLAQHIRKAV